MALRTTMNTIGVGIRERNKLVSDGFNSMDDIVTLHTNDVDGFADYLRTLNKAFASSSTVNLRAYFSPVTVKIPSTKFRIFCQLTLQSHQISHAIIAILEKIITTMKRLSTSPSSLAPPIGSHFAINLS